MAKPKKKSKTYRAPEYDQIDLPDFLYRGVKKGEISILVVRVRKGPDSRWSDPHMLYAPVGLESQAMYLEVIGEIQECGLEYQSICYGRFDFGGRE